MTKNQMPMKGLFPSLVTEIAGPSILKQFLGTKMKTNRFSESAINSKGRNFNVTKTYCSLKNSNKSYSIFIILTNRMRNHGSTFLSIGVSKISKYISIFSYKKHYIITVVPLHKIE